MSGATQIHGNYAGWNASTPSSPGATSPPVQQHPWQPYPQQQPTLTPSAGALVLYNPQSLFGLYYNEHLHGPFATGMGVNPFTPGAAEQAHSCGSGRGRTRCIHSCIQSMPPVRKPCPSKRTATSKPTSILVFAEPTFPPGTSTPRSAPAPAACDPHALLAFLTFLSLPPRPVQPAHHPGQAQLRHGGPPAPQVPRSALSKRPAVVDQRRAVWNQVRDIPYIVVYRREARVGGCKVWCRGPCFEWARVGKWCRTSQRAPWQALSSARRVVIVMSARRQTPGDLGQ